MPRANIVIPQTESDSSPIYRALEDAADIGAAYTGRGTAPQNGYFSFHRPSDSDSTDISKQFRANLQYLAHHEGFDPRRVALPNGAWPHSGSAIKAETYGWVTDPRSNTIMPVTRINQPVAYDAVATRSHKYVLGVQGADCPAIFLYDPRSHVIGLAHAGWKPIVRGVVKNVIDVMLELGARPQNILAYISPGAGDSYNAFKWDDVMEPCVRKVFVEAGRSDLLQDRTIRHDMTHEDLVRLRFALGREIHGGISLKLSSLAVSELRRCGVPVSNISRSLESSIVDQCPRAEPGDPTSFKYHSYRREYPHHGLSMSVIFLKPNGPQAS